MEKELKKISHVYLRHGSKKHRRKQITRLATVVEDIRLHENGVNSVYQIGRKHVSNYYRRHVSYSEATLNDKYYLFVLLWALLGRAGNPPHFKKHQH